MFEKTIISKDGKLYERGLSPYAGVYTREIYIPKHTLNKPVLGPYLLSYLKNSNCYPY